MEALNINKEIIKTYKKKEFNVNKDSNKVFILNGSKMLLKNYFMYIILAKEKLVWIAYQKVEAIFE